MAGLLVPTSARRGAGAVTVPAGAGDAGVWTMTIQALVAVATVHLLTAPVIEPAADLQ